MTVPKPRGKIQVEVLEKAPTFQEQRRLDALSRPWPRQEAEQWKPNPVRERLKAYRKAKREEKREARREVSRKANQAHQEAKRRKDR